MKSWIVHLKNQFPLGVVIATQNAIDLFLDGVHHIAIRNCDGSWLCKGEELGTTGRLDLSPIPKEARVHKLNADGSIGLDEEHEARVKARADYLCDKGKRVLSCAELKKKGYEFQETPMGNSVIFGRCTLNAKAAAREKSAAAAAAEASRAAQVKRDQQTTHTDV